jgi:hypothetical protein
MPKVISVDRRTATQPTKNMKKETASQVMTRTAAEFEELIQAIRNQFYDLPAPESDFLHWGHVGDAIRITGALHDILPEE